METRLILYIIRYRMNIYISEKLLWTILWSSAQQVEDGKLIIVQEGSIQKFKKKLLGSQGILLRPNPVWLMFWTCGNF